MWNGSSSYPFQIAAHYGIAQNQVVDAACSGATTRSLIVSRPCSTAPGVSLAGKSQIAAAMTFLKRNRGSVALVTIDIGGNDFLQCVAISTGSINAKCITRVERGVHKRLSSILRKLRNAAGPSVPIIGMNYYDPFLGDWVGGGSLQNAAIQSVSTVDTIDSFLGSIYGRSSDKFADVESAFRTTDLTDVVSSPWGQVPVAVNNACSWLDIGCSPGQPEGFGDDPDGTGATVIAQTFEQVIGASLP